MTCAAKLAIMPYYEMFRMIRIDPETVLDPSDYNSDTGPDSPDRDRSDTRLRSADDDESVHSHVHSPFSDSVLYLGSRNKISSSSEL